MLTQPVLLYELGMVTRVSNLFDLTRVIQIAIENLSMSSDLVTLALQSAEAREEASEYAVCMDEEGGGLQMEWL